MSQLLVDRVRSVLTDTKPSWSILAPETITIVRLCLGCRSNQKAEEKLDVLAEINKSLYPAMRGEWSDNVEVRFVEKIEPAYRLRLAQRLSGKEPSDHNVAIGSLINFYRDVWHKFNVWERKQPGFDPESSDEVAKTDPPVSLPEPEPDVKTCWVSDSIPVDSEQQPSSIDSIAPGESDPVLRSTAAWSTPWTFYRGYRYSVFGDPGNGANGCFWHCSTRESGLSFPVISVQSYPLVGEANIAARQAIDALVGSPPLESPASEFKRGSRRGKNANA